LNCGLDTRIIRIKDKWFKESKDIFFEDFISKQSAETIKLYYNIRLNIDDKVLLDVVKGTLETIKPRNELISPLLYGYMYDQFQYAMLCKVNGKITRNIIYKINAILEMSLEQHILDNMDVKLYDL